MNVAMVFPTRESEKAISGYSINLVNALKKNNVDVDEITYTAGKPWTFFKKMSRMNNYNVIHLQHEYNLLGGFGLPFFLLYFYLWVTGIKTVTTMHNVLSKNEKFKSGAIKTFLRRILYWTQNKVIGNVSDIVILHANFFKDILVSEYNVSKKKILTIPQGIIEDIPKHNKNKIKKEMNLSGPVYLFMGSMIPDHGHDIVINQAKEVGKTILVVANPGSVNDRNNERTMKYIKQNQKHVKKNNLSKLVRFDISNINDKSPLWWKYFAAADLVLLSYRGGIGSGIFAHAMAAKRPVIASNIQFFEEISKKFGCVKTVSKYSEYPKVIKEAMKPKEYKKMLKECERYLKENSWDSITKKYKKIYTNIIK